MSRITVGEQIERSMRSERTFVMLSLTFGVLAVVLSAVGLYGVMANAVGRRTRELRIRFALSAGPRGSSDLCSAMPDEHYSFRPVPETRSFGEAVAHVADSRVERCALVSGRRKTVNAESKKSEADLVAALRESYEICDAAFDALTDVSMTERVRLERSTRYRSKMGLFVGMTPHSNEQYGYMAVYLRLKGIGPRSSESQ